MKKSIALLLAISLFLLASACSGPSQTEDKAESKVNATTEEIKKTEAESKETAEADTEKESAAPETSADASAAETPAETSAAAGTEEAGAFEGPYIVTTCGQSPGAVQIGMAAKMAGIVADAESTLKAADLDTEKYKTLIVTTGTSMKGMGAAGTDVNAEIARCTELIKKAQEAGMNVVGAHVEGMARRMDNSDQASIDAVMALVDTILIVKASDEDGFFTKYAEENNKKLVVADDAIAVGNALK